MTIDKIFAAAIEKGASDVHLIANQKPAVRIDGVLYNLEDKAVSAKAMEEIVSSLLTAEQKTRLAKERDIDFSYDLRDSNRVRVNVHYTQGSLGLAARIIPDAIPSMKDLQMPEVTYPLLTRQQGLILVTGPTGCGKSTTLAAMIEHINTEQNKNIITLEDPVEFLFEPKSCLVTQRELGIDMPTFASGLRHALRQDPDVIMVGEMRDLETIATALTLAETGHLILATLHTYSAAQTVDRIIDIFPPHQQDQVRTQLAAVLTAVISQRLLPTKKSGRVAAREILLNTPAVSNLIRENKISQINHIIETSAREGMVTMEKSLQTLCKAEAITKETLDLYSSEYSFS